MMATSSGPCDSPAVSTRSIGLVSHDRHRASRRARRPRHRSGTSASPRGEDPHLQQGLVQQHPESRGRGPARALPRRREGGRPVAVDDVEQQAAVRGEGVGRGIRHRRVARQRRDRDRRPSCSAAVVERTPRSTATPSDAPSVGERLPRPRAGARRPRRCARRARARATSAEVAVAPAPTIRARSSAVDALVARARATMPPTSVLNPRGPSGPSSSVFTAPVSSARRSAAREPRRRRRALSGIVSDRPRQLVVERRRARRRSRPRRPGGARTSSRARARGTRRRAAAATGCARSGRPRPRGASPLGLSTPSPGGRCTRPATARRRGRGRRGST